MEPEDTKRRPLEVPGLARLRPRLQDSEGTSWVARYGLALILLALLAGFSLAKSSSFATWDNYRSILNNEAVIVLLGLGAMLPLIAGEFDLSVSASLGMAGSLVTGLCALQGLPPALAVPLAVLAGAMLGLINGLIIVKLKITAFVATLATGTVVGGLVTWYTGGSPIYEGVPESLTGMTRGSVAGIPLPVIYMAVVAALLWFALGRLPVGRRLYVVGGNRRAARLSGIRADRLVVASFIMSGVLAALAGVVLGSELGSYTPGGESAYLLPAFACAFLGATAIQPGHFNPIGTVLGAYVLSVAISGLEQLGAPAWVQPVFNGTVLVVAVGLSGYATRIKAAQARARQLARIGGGGQHGVGPSHDDALAEDRYAATEPIRGDRTDPVSARTRDNIAAVPPNQPESVEGS
jgi:ribose transport system permease protein